MSIEIELNTDAALNRMLNSLDNRNMYSAISAAAQRAAVHARKVGTKEIRKVYAVKAGTLKGKSNIKKAADGAVLEVKGGSEPIKSYSVAAKRKGIFVSVKKGKKTLVPRSFTLNNRFVARESSSRLPFRDLYGPAVPQLFGNPAVLEKVQEAGTEMFESRLMHEITRRLEQ
ncbi:hypothetical protein [Selenomonas sp. AE3005]|uniref:hypothetical protein n=1 Tax=Selenomonas sp. AE3005 TaxID=1485543 RepID=UPI0025FE052D|nr:hypothetical protein [Selenomonas sp. AE3005]